MSQLLSDEIRTALSALDANPDPTPDQLRVIRETHRAMLAQLLDFTTEFERTRATQHRAIPVFTQAACAATLYKWLGIGRRRPTAGMGGLRVVGGSSS